MAQAHAYVLSARVGALFDEARKLIGMNRSIPDHLLHMLHDDPDDSSYLKTWRVERTVNGFTLDMQGDSAKEHAQGMEVLKALLAADVTPMAVRSGGGIQGANAATVSAKAGITVGEATRKYLLTIDSALLPDKTRSQKRAAVNGFAQWKGLKKPLADCSRTDVAEWVQSLRVARLATPTLANKTSYLKAFFEWSQTAGYFPKGDNPAQGQVKYGVREKRLRRKLGFEAFTPEQLSVIYGPKFSTLRTEIQLGALLGLYTGARVSELGQLRLDDFVEEDGLPCIRISADGEGQSLKTDASAHAPATSQTYRVGCVAACRVASKSRANATVSSDKSRLGQRPWEFFERSIRALHQVHGHPTAGRKGGVPQPSEDGRPNHAERRGAIGVSCTVRWA